MLALVALLSLSAIEYIEAPIISGADQLEEGLKEEAAPGARKLANGAGDLNDGLGELGQHGGLVGHNVACLGRIAPQVEELRIRVARTATSSIGIAGSRAAQLLHPVVWTGPTPIRSCWAAWS